MHKSKPILENETNNILWDFGMQTEHLILASWPELVIINKKRETAEWWTLWQQSENQNKRKER